VAGRWAAGFLPVVTEGRLAATAAGDEGTEEDRREIRLIRLALFLVRLAINSPDYNLN
jgi:hypothetical protein